MEAALWLLRLAPALTMVVFGIHQFAKPSGWLVYIPPGFSKISPIKPETTMQWHALGNIVFGLFLASGWHPLLSAWVAFLWWITILPFAFRYNWAIGLRDLTITAGLLALILLIK